MYENNLSFCIHVHVHLDILTNISDEISSASHWSGKECASITFTWADPGVAGGAHPLPAERSLFPAESSLFAEECNFQCLSPCC
jgi:hypothetical protein